MSNYRKKFISCFDIGEVPRSHGKLNWKWLSFLPFIFIFEQCARQAQFPLCDGAALQQHCNSSSEFRTITGVCNNLNHPDWGAANTLLSREIDVEENDENHIGE